MPSCGRIAGSASGELVGALGELGKMLAELDSRDVRRNGLELAAVLDRGFGLGIETVDVARAAGKVDEDGGGCVGVDFYFASFGQAEEIGEAQAGSTEHADAEHVATPDSIAILVSCHVRPRSSVVG
jgi:hypothetical protein